MENLIVFLTIQLLNALSLSSLLFLISVGLTIIFGIMHVVNFAHGALYMAGAYAGYALFRYSGSFWLSITVGPLIIGGVGIIMEVFGLRYLYKRLHFYQFLFTFGAASIIEELVKMIWGVQVKSLNVPSVIDGSIKILGESYPRYRLFLIVVGAVVALVFWLFLERTKTGIFIRGAAENSEMVAALGTNVNRLRTFVFLTGTVLSALGGVVVAPLLTIFPEMGISIIVDAFAVVVVGGLGSFFGSILGSLVIGNALTFGNLFFPDFAMAAIYIAMALILIFLPRGFMGKE